MMRNFLKSKIHRATITEANLHYEGSITIDPDLLEAADILPNEIVKVFNINTGARFETYALLGERGKKEICLNGAAARLGEVGDLIIIVSSCWLNDNELECYKPKIVLMEKDNSIKKITFSNDKDC
ncbi:MAG: aspartate 1-decarboxylase [Calditrichia bacterium]|nr:aspartate 1-decarboxylase [Calditrichia bacterium]